MFSHSLPSYKKAVRSAQGFGLIELMVSISVMVLVTAILLVRQSAFNGTVLLRSQAYEVALSAREIQLNAVSASTIQGNSRDMLGIYFNQATPTLYRYFRDADGDGLYDTAEAFGQTGVVSSPFEIRAIRADAVTQSEITVVFERPNYDARFFSPAGQLAASRVEIDIGAPDKPDIRTVVITSAGQITVQ